MMDGAPARILGSSIATQVSSLLVWATKSGTGNEMSRLGTGHLGKGDDGVRHAVQ